MVQNRQVTLLGDSILKGIQVDLGDRRYRTHNEINMEALESEFQLSIHNDAHFGATVRKGSRLLDRMLARKLPCDMRTPRGTISPTCRCQSLWSCTGR